jgi:hypothetical protein
MKVFTLSASNFANDGRGEMTLESSGGTTYTLVIISALRCAYCMKMKNEKVVEKLAQANLPEVSIGELGLDTNKGIIQTSKGTGNEIKEVPYIILYAGRISYRAYPKGLPKTPEVIIKFLNETIKIHKEQTRKLLQEQSNKGPVDSSSQLNLKGDEEESNQIEYGANSFYHEIRTEYSEGCIPYNEGGSMYYICNVDNDVT